MKRLPVFVAAALLVSASLLAQGRRTVALIVTGGTVVTQNATRQVLAPGAVAIDGTNIVEVGTADTVARKYQGRETIDARGLVVLPGLINTHTHAPMVMYRGLADDLALMDWLQKYIFPAEAKTVSPEFVRIGTRLAALEMIESARRPSPTCITSRRRSPRRRSRPGCAACSARRSSSFRSRTRRRRPR